MTSWSIGFGFIPKAELMIYKKAATIISLLPRILRPSNSPTTRAEHKSHSL